MPEYLKKGDEIDINKFGLGTFIVRLEMPTNFIDDINKMPGAKWFKNSRLNFAENLLRFRDNRTAIQFTGEKNYSRTMSYIELYNEVEKLAYSLRSLGIQIEQGESIKL